MIRGDSSEYELLQKCIKNYKYNLNQEYILTCEIGVREGLGSKIIIDEVHNSKTGKPHYHIGIDPYGNLKYQHYDESGFYQADYTNDMYIQCVKDFIDYKNFTLFKLSDVEFMKRYVDGIPTYDYSSFQVLNIYDFVHFDGPHTTKDVLREVIFFADRSKQNTRFVFDDYKLFDFELIERVLRKWNFNRIDYGQHKICYERYN